MDLDESVRRLSGAIRARREALGFSQDSFAYHIEMHRAYFAAIERGEKNITVQTLVRIAAGLKTTVAAITADAGL
jgi:transcriptional regulator with XRE-family HTH domain